MLSSYFQAYNNYFWQWEENSGVLAIPKSNTIAYKELVEKTLKELAGQGLPRFGSLLLAIIAINPEGKKALHIVKEVLASNDSLMSSESLKKTLDFLFMLSEVPDNYKSGRNKFLLLKTIFEECHGHLAYSDSATIIKKKFINNLPTSVLKGKELKGDIVEKDFKTIYLLNKKFKCVDDILKKIGELPELNEELNLEEEEAEPKDLIEQLSTDARTYKIGTLVKTIWSGLNLPFHSVVPSQQPIGGVSDVSNKGNLDQLLISEFANEDIVFLSRLANNEALYLNRESPPSSSDLKRVILIDVSLKNWGLPKAIAFATMLAITKHPKTDIECEVFLVGDSVHPVNFNSLDGIVDALQIVEASIDSSKGLKQYFETYPSSKNRELFILTEHTATKRNSIHKLVNEYNEYISYYMYNDAGGRIDVFKTLKKGKKHLQHLELPLNNLWNQRIKKRQKKSNTRNDFYPILTRSSQNYYGILPTDNGEVFQFTKEKSLLRLYSKYSHSYEIGWELFYENLPTQGQNYEIGVLNNGDYVVLLFQTQSKEIILLNTRTRVEKRIIFPHWKSISGRGFVFYNQYFVHCNNNGCWSIDMDGNIKALNENPTKLFEERDKKIREVSSKYRTTTGIFKNIRKVGINEAGNLMFNVHELVLNQGNHIKLNVTDKKIKNIAHEINTNCFEFPDGSIIEINKSGLIIMKSSDNNIPAIYFPSVLDSSLGITTKEEFAGNVFYYKEPLYELILNDSGNNENKLHLVKIVKELTSSGVLVAKEIVENAPRNLLQFFNEKEAIEAKTRLEENGAVVEIIPVHSVMQQIEKLDPDMFFHRNITPYIHTIQSHGSEN